MIHISRVCVSNKVKNMNAKVLNLMSGVNELRLLVQHESCKCNCGLNQNVCIQNKNRLMMNVGVSVKNNMIGVLVKIIICGILVRLFASVRHARMFTNCTN